jgi:hypothetical protein
MGSPISKDTFLARAMARFGDRYLYEAIVYKSYKTPIRIHCRLHPVKEISITPEKHLQTTGGCKFCLRESRSVNSPASPPSVRSCPCPSAAFLPWAIERHGWRLPLPGSRLPGDRPRCA